VRLRPLNRSFDSLLIRRPWSCGHELPKGPGPIQQAHQVLSFAVLLRFHLRDILAMLIGTEARLDEQDVLHSWKISVESEVAAR